MSKFGKFEYFPKLKKTSGELVIFEPTNWDFTDKFLNILGVIKVQFSQRLRDFIRIEKLLKILIIRISLMGKF